MSKSTKSPFFAKFLENQIENDNKVVGGNPWSTKPTLDVMHTMKYPSDGEDSGGGTEI